MKRIVFAFAALLAATGFATANEVHAKKPHYPAAREQRIYDQRVDCWHDWSGKYYEECLPVHPKPLLGIDIDPFWIMQDLHP